MNPVVVIGSAECWNTDLENFRQLCQNFDIIAIGFDCQYQGKIDFFATYHYPDIQKYKEKRIQNGLDIDFKVIHHKTGRKKTGIDIIEPYQPPTGSSALLGVLSAISQGYKKIVLCGCPMEGKSAWTPSYKVFQRGWIRKSKEVAPFVRSMSGWTASFLGSPSKEWIDEN